MLFAIEAERAHLRARASRLVVPVLPAIKAMEWWRVHSWIRRNRPQPSKHHAVQPGGLRRGVRYAWRYFVSLVRLLPLALLQPLLSRSGRRRRALSSPVAATRAFAALGGPVNAALCICIFSGGGGGA